MAQLLGHEITDQKLRIQCFVKKKKGGDFGLSIQIIFFPYLEFYFLGFDSLFKLVPVSLEVSEDLWVYATDTMFQ